MSLASPTCLETSHVTLVISNPKQLSARSPGNTINLAPDKQRRIHAISDLASSDNADNYQNDNRQNERSAVNCQIAVFVAVTVPIRMSLLSSMKLVCQIRRSRLLRFELQL